MTDTPRIALLGTGIMGRPMAANLLQAGFPVTAWNRTRAKAEPLAAAGARIADSALEAVAGADLVITMLENGPVVTEVLFGGTGAAKGARPGTLFVDMSSIPPALARDHATLHAANGCSALDAPVSGGEPGAIAATLAIMAGGGRQDFERALPAFRAMGRPTWVGPAGAGQIAKLANQAIVGITIGAVAEGLLLAAAGGADPAAVREAITGGFATSRILELHGQKMLERNWVPGGSSRIMLKDMETVLQVAEGLGLDLPFTRQARDGYAELMKGMDLGRTDHAALLLWLEARSGAARVGTAPDRMP